MNKGNEAWGMTNVSEHKQVWATFTLQCDRCCKVYNEEPQLSKQNLIDAAVCDGWYVTSRDCLCLDCSNDKSTGPSEVKCEYCKNAAKYIVTDPYRTAYIVCSRHKETAKKNCIATPEILTI